MTGNIDLVLNNKPSEQNLEYYLVNYTCTSKTIESRQVSIVANYENANCDSYSVLTKNSPSTLSVSLKSSLNKNCKKSNELPLIIGLSVGVPIFVILCISLTIYLVKRKNERSLQSFGKDNYLQDMKESYDRNN